MRRKPYSVVLLDEVEKAHPDMHELFFQVFDKGIMEDGNGRAINFKNCLILLTSNVGTDVIMDMAEGGNTKPDVEELCRRAEARAAHDVFPPALLGRIVSIPVLPAGDRGADGYYPLEAAVGAEADEGLPRRNAHLIPRMWWPISSTNAATPTAVAA